MLWMTINGVLLFKSSLAFNYPMPAPYSRLPYGGLFFFLSPLLFNMMVVADKKL